MRAQWNVKHITDKITQLSDIENFIFCSHF
ncbi:hypothetical protein MTR67_027138 [Solanum verrucosum]|uniref:Uncharacterized protein n=1 Tax=Solanum verrucosum TaxID=315347 RepID=A0AAF0R469_SOLVR|nr:hypothetical protein MTR67_027138 [Solanum verrucosum]